MFFGLHFYSLAWKWLHFYSLNTILTRFLSSPKSFPDAKIFFRFLHQNPLNRLRLRKASQAAAAFVRWFCKQIIFLIASRKSKDFKHITSLFSTVILPSPRGTSWKEVRLFLFPYKICVERPYYRFSSFAETYQSDLLPDRLSDRTGI